MATRAVMALAQPEREALALAWLGMSLAQVARIVGVSVPAAAGLLNAGQERLRRAVAAEVLAGRDPGECGGRSALLAGRRATLQAGLADRLLAHAESCPDCSPHLPREVSPAKICSLLPFPRPTSAPVADLSAAELAAAAELATGLATELAARAASGPGAPPASRDPAAERRGPGPDDNNGRPEPGTEAEPGSRTEPGSGAQRGSGEPAGAAGRLPGSPVPTPRAGPAAPGPGFPGQAPAVQVPSQRTAAPGTGAAGAAPGSPATSRGEPAPAPGAAGPALGQAGAALGAAGAALGRAGAALGVPPMLGAAVPASEAPGGPVGPGAPEAPAGVPGVPAGPPGEPVPGRGAPAAGPAAVPATAADGGEPEACRSELLGPDGRLAPGWPAASPPVSARAAARRRRMRWPGWLAVLVAAVAAAVLALSTLGWPGTGWELRPTPSPSGSAGPGTQDRPGTGYPGGAARHRAAGSRQPRVQVPAYSGQQGMSRGATPMPTLTGTPVPGAGHLVVYPGTLRLGHRSKGFISITATGGPVTWSARPSSEQVSLGRQAGRLAAGDKTVVPVRVSSGQPGWAEIRIMPGGMTVQVSWDGPSPSPSASPTPSPSPSESGSPSSSASPSPSGSPASPTASG